jgi:4-diphosphocytidyl-2-C-methyl-D-erythritol kinase
MPNSILKLPAPAKFNHFLHVCGRRSDGYHNLQTAFQFLDIADELTFTQTNQPDIQLLTSFKDVPPQDNLILKAASALKNATHYTGGATISIEKNLPMGAGIGGGSSNAATTLVALNHLWQTGLNQTQLQQIGVKLGADVPIFIHGHSAWAEGIGEQLTDITLPEKYYLLLFPPCHVSTAVIFSHPELTRDSKMMKIAAFLEQGNSPLFQNDCERLVRKLYSEVDEALNTLSTHTNARMTGTGACVFASFDCEAEALETGRKMPEKFRAVISKSLNESPLYTALCSVR